MDINKAKLRQIILEELQGMLDEGYSMDAPLTPEEKARLDSAWARAKMAPPKPPKPKQASAIQNIASMLLNTGLDPNDASVWEMVKDAAKRSGGMFPKAEGLEEELGLGDLQSDEKFTGGTPEEQMLRRIKARELLAAMSKEELAALSKSLDAETVAELRHLLANPMYDPMKQGGEMELEETQDPEELRRRRAMLKQAALEVDRKRLHVGDLKRIQQRVRDGERVHKIVRDYPRNFPAYK
jgi:hypothetical protein